MRIVLTNFGTTGDIQPFLALAVTLHHHGHEPVVAFSPNHAQRADGLNLPFVAVGPDLQEEQRRINRAWATIPESATTMRGILAPVAESLPQAFETLRAVCQDADLLISGPAQPAGRMIHELSGIPFVSVQLSNFGGAGPPALQQAGAALINPFRAKVGLPPLSHPLTLDANSPQLALYAISRHILPRPADWPDHYHLTGYFFLDDMETEIDPALVAFMAAGERPVVITFGSMTDEDPHRLTALLIEAIRITGRRAVIQQNWRGLDTDHLPAYIFPAGYVPHTWLFPRAACIVHHGGGGTAGAVFRSGIPSLFLPHGQIFDQFYLAIVAEELGCAGPAIPYGELTAAWLADALLKTISTSRYYEAAAALGEKVGAEQGVQKARQLIENLAHKLGLTTNATSGFADIQDRADKVNRRKQYQQAVRSRRR